MRNPDPAPRRFTSLAWAAVLGHEETFEYLLSVGHDDEELSKVRLTLPLVPLYYDPDSHSLYSSGFGKQHNINASLRPQALVFNKSVPIQTTRCGHRRRSAADVQVVL